MGKDLRGKELGSGLSQRKDGYYVGRYTTREGKRQQKIFQKLHECRKWVADSQYNEKHSTSDFPANLTVSDWYEYWIAAKKRSVRISTYEHYVAIYKRHIEPVLANKPLKNVTSLDCQKILNKLADKGRSNSLIMQVRIALHNMFDYAYQNDVLAKNPCNKSVKWNIGEKAKDRKALTLEQQKLFSVAISGHRYERCYRFALQTGLRAGEISGLEWENVDFKNKTISINKTRRYVSDSKGWRTGDTKTKSGNRIVPLTSEAFLILEEIRKENDKRKSDREWKDTIFLKDTGKPISNQDLDCALRTICKNFNLPVISMHILRHTFATRCVEAGMNVKTLQTILGHSSISMTMDIYVHMTEEQKMKEICNVEYALKSV